MLGDGRLGLVDARIELGPVLEGLFEKCALGAYAGQGLEGSRLRAFEPQVLRWVFGFLRLLPREVT